MKEFTITDLLDIFLDNIKIIIISIILCIMASFIYEPIIIRPLYESKTKIMLVKPASTTTITAADISFNQKLILSYSEILKSNKVVSKVITELSLKDNAENLVSNIEISQIKDTEILDITFRYSNPEAASQILNTLITNFKAEVKDIYNIDNIKQVDVAHSTNKIVNIDFMQNIILAIFLGFIFPYGILFATEYFNFKLRSSGDIEENLKLEILGMLPIVENRKNQDLRIVLKSYSAATSELIKILITNIQFQLTKEQKVLTVTSSSSKEGKTFVTSSLGIALAKLNKKVLLIDLNLRSSEIHKIFSLNNTLGITELLKADKDKEDLIKKAIKKTHIDNLYVITSGKNVNESVELLSNNSLSELLLNFKTEYDYILIDTPEINIYADTPIICKSSDATILIGTVAKTKLSIMSEAKKILEKHKINILGVIINKTPIKRREYKVKGYEYNNVEFTTDK